MAAVQVAFIRNVCGSPFLIFSFSQVFSSFFKNDNFKKYFTQERSIYESNSARRAVSEKSCIRLGFVLHVYSGIIIYPAGNTRASGIPGPRVPEYHQYLRILSRYARAQQKSDSAEIVRV